MRDWFIFRYNGRYFQCVALPFGWGRSPLWFTHFMNVFVKELRRLGYRVLPYLDDFLISPSPYGIVANPRRCTTAARNIDGVLKRLGLVRHPQKGNWTGARVVEHLGVIVDTINMKFLVAPRKVKKVRELARKLMKEVRHGRRWVSQRSLSHFCGVCVSLTLAMPWARFYTRSLYWDMSSSRPRDNHNRCRLSHQSIRSVNVAAVIPSGFELTTNASHEARCLCTYGCCRCGLWRYGKHQLFSCRSRWRVFHARDLELEGSFRDHFLQRVKGCKEAVNRSTRQKVGGTITEKFTITRGQHVCRTYYQFMCVSESSNDAGITEAETGLGPPRHPSQDRMVAFSGQQIRGRALATLPRGDLRIRKQLRRSVQDASIRRDRSNLESGGGSITVPASGVDRSNRDEIDEDTRPSRSDDTGLAQTTLARSSDEDSPQVGDFGVATSGNLGRTATVEPAVASTAVGGQSRMTRSMVRLDLANAGAARVAQVAGDTPGATMSAELVADFAWSSRTTSTRNSQWRTFVLFCEEEQRPVLPVTEAHFVAFVGWVALQRQNGKRQISSTSLPQYISAVRQMQLMLTGTPVADYPFVGHVIRGYRQWEEENYPQREVRLGISAAVIQRIWALGMRTTAPRVLRDTALCVFSFCFCGLRESSAVSVLTENVTFEPDRMTARLSVLKGRPASQAPLVSYARISSLSSPLDLWKRWKNARGQHPRFFGLPGEQEEGHSRTLEQALQNCLGALHISPPTGGAYHSHSLRIGAHTEQILLHIPLEARLSRFGWDPRSQEMAFLYFDRTISLSQASFWAFGAHPTVVAAASTSLN